MGLVAIAAVIGALGAAPLGCGGASSGRQVGGNIRAAEFKHQPPPRPSKAAFRRRVEKICANVDKEIAGLAETPGSAGSIMAISAMGKSSLELVRPPAAFSPAYSAFLRWLRLRAPLRGDFFRELTRNEHARSARRYRTYTDRARRKAGQLGLRNCPFR